MRFRCEVGHEGRKTVLGLVQNMERLDPASSLGGTTTEGTIAQRRKSKGDRVAVEARRR